MAAYVDLLSRKKDKLKNLSLHKYTASVERIEQLTSQIQMVFLDKVMSRLSSSPDIRQRKNAITSKYKKIASYCRGSTFYLLFHPTIRFKYFVQI